MFNIKFCLWIHPQGPLHGLLQMASSLAIDHNNFSDPSKIIKQDAGPGEKICPIEGGGRNVLNYSKKN